MNGGAARRGGITRSGGIARRVGTKRRGCTCRGRDARLYLEIYAEIAILS